MTTLRIPVILIVAALFSCNNSETIKKPDNTTTDTLQASAEDEKQVIKNDTIKRFEEDDYPVTDDMFGRDTDGRKIKSGKLVSLDKAWFSNDTLKQVLVFELYTDNFRMNTYHFYKTEIPAELINSMELTVDGGDTASNAQKLKDFKGFLSKTQQINERYFTTNKGLKPGDDVSKAIKNYGEPDNIRMRNGIEEYSWEFVGDFFFDGKADLKGKPLAKDSYGHQIKMFVKNKKLVGLIFRNDIP